MVRRIAKIVWLALLGVAVVLHATLTTPLSNPADLIAVIGLMLLFGTNLILAWPWLRILLLKIVLYISNSASAWSMEVSWGIELGDLDFSALMCNFDDRVAKKWPEAKRLRSPDDLRIEIKAARKFAATVQFLSTDECDLAKLSIDGVALGYRDAIRSFVDQIEPLISAVESSLPLVSDKQIGLTSDVRGKNPFYSALAAQSQIVSAESFFIRFTHQSGASVTMTKNQLQVSAAEVASIRQAMSAIFGLSFRGAMGAGNI